MTTRTRTRTLTLTIQKAGMGEELFAPIVKAALCGYLARMVAGSAGHSKSEFFEFKSGVVLLARASCEPPL